MDYGAQRRVVAGVEHATVVRSTNGAPIVAERLTVDEGPEPDDDDGSDARPDEVSAAVGSPLAATLWRVPLPDAGVDGADGGSAVVVFNPGLDGSVRVRLAGPDGDIGSALSVPGGERRVIPLDGDVLDVLGEGAGLSVEADGPVVVERVVRSGDGRRITVGPAVPASGGAVDLGA